MASAAPSQHYSFQDIFLTIYDLLYPSPSIACHVFIFHFKLFLFYNESQTNTKQFTIGIA